MTSAGGLVDADRFVGKDSILSGPAGGVIGFSRVAQRAGFREVDRLRHGGHQHRRLALRRPVRAANSRRKRPACASSRRCWPSKRSPPAAAASATSTASSSSSARTAPAPIPAPPATAAAGRSPSPTSICFSARFCPRDFRFRSIAAAVERRLETLCDANRRARRWARATRRSSWREGFVRDRQCEHGPRDPQDFGRHAATIPRDYVLVTFGGAGGQHACALARALGMRQILVASRTPGMLSAYGIGLADVRRFARAGRAASRYSADTLGELEPLFAAARSPGTRRGARRRDRRRSIDCRPVRSLDLRYQGSRGDDQRRRAPPTATTPRRYERTAPAALRLPARRARRSRSSPPASKSSARMPDPPETGRRTSCRDGPTRRETTTAWFDGRARTTRPSSIRERSACRATKSPARRSSASRRRPSSSIPGFTAPVLAARRDR